ncbi:hypothetical protein [Nostoc sp.]|uniref:hypothetical protein n=1 Tax=Nostoc sp. TaxID=1180 RepID=UPI002FFB70DF
MSNKKYIFSLAIAAMPGLGVAAALIKIKRCLRRAVTLEREQRVADKTRWRSVW